MVSKLIKLFQKKKLSLKEIHRLYKVLQHCLPAQEQSYLIDEIDKMLEMAEPGTMLKALEILYKKNLEKENTLSLLLLFIKGLRDNEFFDYVHFIQGLNGGRDRKA